MRAIQGIVDEHADFHDCHLLRHITAQRGAAHFLHYRCLSPALGYPDDLAVHADCRAGAVRLWLHSQSRLPYAQWDHGLNDARVRRILMYAQLPPEADWFPWAAMMRTNESCL